MLLKTRKEFNPENLLENADMPFHVFLNKWLKENAFSFSPSTYAEYAYDVRSQIEPFFEKHPIGLLKMSGRDLRHFIAMKDRNTRLLRRNCCNTTR